MKKYKLLLIVAILLLATSKVDGQQVSFDTKQIEVWQKEALSGNSEAQGWLGLAYMFGEGVNRDSEKGFYWMSKSADAGDDDAQSFLGDFYREGLGAKKDLSKAIYWYQKAAESGQPLAIYNLAGMYRSGEGVNQDYFEAVEWYKKGAIIGSPDCQNKLGEMYAEGQGVPKDLVIAVAWLNLASAANGGKHAAKLRDKLEKKMSPAQINEAQILSTSWKPGENITRN